MTTLGLDLNDAALVAVRSDGTSRMEPGCALVDEAGVRVGVEAARAARLAPRHVDESYWAELSLSPWSRPHPRVRCSADLAYAQLAALWSRLGQNVDAVAFAIPGWLRPEQLRLVLGIAQACDMPVVGFVDAAVAALAAIRSTQAAASEHGHDRLLHVELGLHAAVLTTLEHRNGEIVKKDVRILATVGMRAMRRRLVERVASLFVRETRFDPLHAATAEQELWDRLPGWLDLVSREGSARAELEGHTLELSANAVVIAVDDLYEQIHRAAASCERTDARFLGATAARLPGLAERLAPPGDSIERLSPDAAARGTLAHLDEIRGTGKGVELSNALRVPAR